MLIKIQSQCIDCKAITEWEEDFPEDEVPSMTIHICPECIKREEYVGKTEDEITDIVVEKLKPLLDDVEQAKESTIQ